MKKPPNLLTPDQFFDLFMGNHIGVDICVYFDDDTIPDWGRNGRAPQFFEGKVKSATVFGGFSSDMEYEIQIIRPDGGGNILILQRGWACIYSGKNPAAKDCCPTCGDQGEWAAMAVRCRKGHGPFIGGPL
jgi:hypothetical protein